MLLQRWRRVVFLHWPVPADRIDAMLPQGLNVDTWEGDAWLTLTPFHVDGSRPALVPPIPGVSNFIESNVRTYVIGPDGRDGLWFFTLETNSLPTTIGANITLGVPYRWAAAAEHSTGGRTTYRTRRRLADPAPEQSVTIDTRARRSLADTQLTAWLTGRWRAWTTIGRRLAVVPVEHEPWPIRAGELVEQHGTLLASLGLPAIPVAPIVQWSPGVEARLGWPSLHGRADRS